jgi:hypothetical protein
MPDGTRRFFNPGHFLVSSILGATGSRTERSARDGFSHLSKNQEAIKELTGKGMAPG